MQEKPEAVITSTNQNNNTSADPSPKLVTSETDRRKKSPPGGMIGSSVETPHKESKADLENKTTGLCGGRRYLSDLDSFNPQTKFPTKCMSDHSDYVRQATVGDNECNYRKNLETGDVRAINIEEDIQNLLERLLAEEKEKKELETANENKIQKQCWLQYWEEK